ncbi:MAG: response regulator, partial [Bacteroidales bacterium]|nr:response regulator [Bacteroidales bacterium]
ERDIETPAENDQKKILVVEDSITVRTMLKTIIENGGYIVKTAFDGQDGLETLLNESFDLLVTDIEMPRMNGFELTEKVRENSAFTDLPIILVTTLDKPEDKRRGLESGANAYIVKGSFEKSNLIETIRRLI